MKNFWTKFMVVAVVAFVFLILAYKIANAEEKVVYTVKRGDTIGELMFAWKVQGVDIKQLQKWNPDLGTQVSVGQRIQYYLPDKPTQQLPAEQVIKIVEQTIAAQGQKGSRKIFVERTIVFTLTTVFVLVLFLALCWYRTRPAPTPTEKAKVPVESVAPKILTVDLDDGYETDAYWDDEVAKWKLPFHHLTGTDKMYEKSEGDASRVIKKRYRDSRYAEQVTQLRNMKIIRLKQATA